MVRWRMLCCGGERGKGAKVVSPERVHIVCIRTKLEQHILHKVVAIPILNFVTLKRPRIPRQGQQELARGVAENSQIVNPQCKVLRRTLIAQRAILYA